MQREEKGLVDDPSQMPSARSSGDREDATADLGRAVPAPVFEVAYTCAARTDRLRAAVL